MSALCPQSHVFAQLKPIHHKHLLSVADLNEALRRSIASGIISTKEVIPSKKLTEKQPSKPGTSVFDFVNNLNDTVKRKPTSIVTYKTILRNVSIARLKLLKGVYVRFKIEFKILWESSNASCSYGEILKYQQLNGEKVQPHPNERILGQVQKCDRSIYAVLTERIYHEMALVNTSKTRPVYHGKQNENDLLKFGNQYYALILMHEEFDSTYLRGNVGGLSPGGFLLYWEDLRKWATKRKYDSDEFEFQMEMATPLPLGLDSKCATIFVIAIAGIIGCIY